MKGMTYSRLRTDYVRLWQAVDVHEGWQSRATRAATRVMRSRARYETVAIGRMPWWAIGIIHHLECAGDFSKHLHNGDSLTKRTRRVPAGRPLTGQPPFTWEDSARDALTMKDFDKVPVWTISRTLYELERYNGFGYRRPGIDMPAPYLWSGTTHYRRGKFIRDHVYDPQVVSQQVGVAPIILALIALGAVTREQVETGDPTALASPLPNVGGDADIVSRETETNADNVSRETETNADNVSRETIKPLSRSRTLFGALLTYIGWSLDKIAEVTAQAVAVLPDINTKASEVFAPLSNLARMLAINANTVGDVAVFIGLSLVVYAYLNDRNKRRRGWTRLTS